MDLLVSVRIHEAGYPLILLLILDDPLVLTDSRNILPFTFSGKVALLPAAEAFLDGNFGFDTLFGATCRFS